MMGRPSNAIWLILGRFLLRALGHFVAGTLAAAGALAVVITLLAMWGEPEAVPTYVVAGVLILFSVRGAGTPIAILALILAFKKVWLNFLALIFATAILLVNEWSSNLKNCATQAIVTACILAWFEFKLVSQILGRKSDAWN